MSASKLDEGIDSSEIPVVGKNCFNDDDTIDDLLPTGLTYSDPNAEQLEWLRSYKARRDRRALRDALQALVDAARKPVPNVFEAMMVAMDAGATTGEVTGAVRVAYGEPFDPVGMIEAPVELN